MTENKPTPLTKDKEIQGWLYPKEDIKSAVEWFEKKMYSKAEGIVEKDIKILFALATIRNAFPALFEESEEDD